ncbi:MAG: hypothetical protein HY002_21090, partial [Candidatus Rokubacteria bacterium]|nr:hypothetical protein [Candidatus Rokubacteria bacterium]
RKDAGFARVTVGGSYAWRPTPVDTLTAGYTFLAEVYDGLSDADVLDHFWYLDYRRLLRPDLIAGLRVSDEFTQLGEDDFRNQVAVRPAVG